MKATAELLMARRDDAHPTERADLFGKRLDYIWWDRDSGVKQPGGFAFNPTRSSHFGSDHRAVYATINIHAVDLTPPAVSVTAPAAGALVTGPVTVTADASKSRIVPSCGSTRATRSR